MKKCDYFSPWKIPIDLESAVVGGLAGAVELKSFSDQYFDPVWGDLHLFKNKSYKMEAGAR